MAIRVIRSSDYRRMRWKNGQGETAEIAISPAAATVESFAWRISMARIEADGPFSAFPGIDRTLVVVQGAGLELTVDGQTPVAVVVGGPPFSFRGDSATHATLRGGAVTDLNVMTQRNRCWHRVRRLTAADTIVLGTSAAVAAIACGNGARARVDGATAELGALDCALAEPGAAALEVLATGEGGLILVEIGDR